MSKPRPGILAIRALNQYRRRDILIYLGLRYYLNNLSAQSDSWAKEVATKLAETRRDSIYFPAHHFKECTNENTLRHRPMYLPGANEALAEAALLDECSRHSELYNNPTCVYSYKLTSGNDRSGIFEYYSKGLSARHSAIANACDLSPNGVVRYQDIKRFYPSITKDLALKVWKKFSQKAELHARYIALGERLISDHGDAIEQNKDGASSILTGPMFSHLLANLVMRDFDAEYCQKFPGQYFRYVDDIVLVGNSTAVASALKEMRQRLQDLNFILHEDDSHKNIETSTSIWLEGRNDYARDIKRPSWMTLIGDLKRFLIADPQSRGQLQKAFLTSGFRIPVYDYNAAAHEHDYLERLSTLLAHGWFKQKVIIPSADSLVSQALALRALFEQELFELLGSKPDSDFKRKCLIPKMRYRAGRLSYLSTPETLIKLATLMRPFPELHLHAEVMRAIATGNLDGVLCLGTNAAQAAAQPLRAAGTSCTTTLPITDKVVSQSLAVFILNGVTVKHPTTTDRMPHLLQFASTGPTIEIMKSSDPFTREIACLHGLSKHPRHADTLETVFDEDEDLAIDAVDQLQNSGSL